MFNWLKEWLNPKTSCLDNLPPLTCSYPPMPKCNPPKKETNVNINIEERIQSIEDQLKELRKEMQDSYKRYIDPVYNKPTFTNGDLSKFTSGQMGNTECLWDMLPSDDRYKPMSMSCPCRKCSGWC